MSIRTNYALSIAMLAAMAFGLSILVMAAAPWAWLDGWDPLPALLLVALLPAYLAASLALSPGRRHA